VHNGERYLREQLDSVLAQTGTVIEIIALDDASTDGSTGLLSQYAARDPRIRFIRNTDNLGPSRSFERAMALCDNAFIALCDQDDIWAADKLSRLLSAIGSADLAYCDSEYVDAAGASTGQRISNDMTMMSGREPLRFLFANSVSGHAALVRRTLFDAARPFPEGVFHDWWLALCAAARGGIVYVDEPLVRFRRHDGAFSTLGRDKAGRRPPRRNHFWLEQRRNLAAAFAATTLTGCRDAAKLLIALEQARAEHRYLPLARILWRLRAVAPGGGVRVVRYLRLLLRFIRKLRRARKEQSLLPAQFRP